ncbi:MAG TPA: tetratricopeptide repeat protein [Polyangiaceae bacterium]|jgi:tetratricopeptide (TPR) repeat protein|nr:tetratricopeptide repeat protein [Polyangiaceae bacterium]
MGAVSRAFRRLTLALALVAGGAGTLTATGCVRPSATVRAQALVRQGHDEEAVATLQQRLAAHPDDVSARRLLIRVLGATGEIVGARAQVEELSKWLPKDDPAPYLELGHALELTHSYDEALQAYDQAASVAPSSPDGPREGGMRSARWGELEEARPRLEEALRRGSRDVETWHTLGLVRLHLGDYEGAAQAYRAGAEADPKDATCWLGLATVGVVQGNARLALDAYDQVLARSPRFASAELGRAWALAQLGRRDDAAHALDIAQELGAPPGPLAKQRAALANPAGNPLPLPAEGAGTQRAE